MLLNSGWNQSLKPRRKQSLRLRIFANTFEGAKPLTYRSKAWQGVQSNQAAQLVCFAQNKKSLALLHLSAMLRNQKRDGRMEGSAPTTSAINQLVALPAAKLRVQVQV